MDEIQKIGGAKEAKPEMAPPACAAQGAQAPPPPPPPVGDPKEIAQLSPDAQKIQELNQ